MPQTRPIKPQTQKKKTVSRSNYVWTYREKKAILEALKKHGFHDIDKIVSEVQTRDRNEVERFIEKWTLRVRTRLVQTNQIHRMRKAGRPTIADVVENRIPIRIWQKIAGACVPPKLRIHSYNDVLIELFKKFGEEEPECPSENVPNFKAIYKYLQDALAGDIPAVLSPIDSAVVTFLLEDLLSFISTNGMVEEFKFLKNYSGPLNFVPETIKTERLAENESNVSVENCKNPSEPGTSGNCAANNNKMKNRTTTSNFVIPCFLYEFLYKHIKIKDNMNPFVIPVYLLHEEQKMLSKYIENVKNTD